MKKSLLTTLLIITSTSVSAAPLEKEYKDFYASVGYGSNNNLVGEIGRVKEGFGFFAGIGVAMDDDKNGTEGARAFANFIDVNKIETIKQSYANVYGGVNYTIKHSNDVRSTFGVGLDADLWETYSNWYDEDMIFGDDGKFHLEEETGVDIGGIINYKLSYENIIVGLSYRTVNSEFVSSVGYRF